jgi:DUF2993 family protein
MSMAPLVKRRRASLLSLWIGVPLVLVLVLAQVLLPTLAAHRVRDRVARYGTVHGVHVSAFPAIELLWGSVDSIHVDAGALAVSPAQIASLLWEARDVHDLTVSAQAAHLHVPGLPNGLTVSAVRMEKHGSSVHATATLTQAQLNQALPPGFHAEPVASGGGQVEVRASGGLFGAQASLTALVKPLEGRLVAQPQGFPLAGLATVTLFSDPRLRVASVGVGVLRRQSLTYGLSLQATLA